MKLLLLFCMITQFTILGCKQDKKVRNQGLNTSTVNSLKNQQLNTSSGSDEVLEEGGYSGGGGNVNSYSSEEFKTIFQETVEVAKKMHLSIPFYLLFLKFDNKLPAQFEVILDKSLSVGEGSVGVIKNIEIKFDSYCQSENSTHNHASVNYSLDSTVCISSKSLELMSKTELKRKLLALISHEYVHMLGIKDEDLANEYQTLIYNNFYMIDSTYFSASYVMSLRFAYESIYYFFYLDCVLNDLCSDVLSLSAERLIDLKKNKPKRSELLSILNLIEHQIKNVSAAFRGAYFSVGASLIDSNIWKLTDEYLYTDYPHSRAFLILKKYITSNNTIDEDILRKLSVNFVRSFFKLNFIDRMNQVNLVSRNLFFNYCYRSVPMYSSVTNDLLDDFFMVSNFSHKNIDDYLKKYNVYTIYYQNEVIYLPHNRMCSERNIKIPAMEGKPTSPVQDTDVPLEDWSQYYKVYIKK